MPDKIPSAQPTWLAHEQKISVREAARLNDLSEDSFRRHYRHLIHKITPRRDVVTIADAIAIGTNKRSA